MRRRLRASPWAWATAFAVPFLVLMPLSNAESTLPLLGLAAFFGGVMFVVVSVSFPRTIRAAADGLSWPGVLRQQRVRWDELTRIRIERRKRQRVLCLYAGADPMLVVGADAYHDTAAFFAAVRRCAPHAARCVDARDDDACAHPRGA